MQNTGDWTPNRFARTKKWSDAEHQDYGGYIEFISLDEATKWATQYMIGEYQIITVLIHGEIGVETIEKKINKVFAS